MTLISSLRNPQIKQIRALRLRKERERSNSFFVEGIRSVRAAFDANMIFQQLIVVPEELTHPQAQALAIELGRKRVPRLDVSAEVFASLVDKETDVHQGIAAVLRQRWHTLADVDALGGCWVGLEAVQYPGNLGTVLRSCESIGGVGIILVGPTADPHDLAAIRASVGAVFGLRIVRTNPAAFARWARGSPALVVGTSPAASADYRSVEYPSSTVLLMGCERSGLSSELWSSCNEVVQIPMVGSGDSLNLAVATSLLLYEIFRQQHPLKQAIRG